MSHKTTSAIDRLRLFLIAEEIAIGDGRRDPGAMLGQALREVRESRTADPIWDDDNVAEIILSKIREHAEGRPRF